jgi:tetratricopeptide (TPR) repeat protein
MWWRRTSRLTLLFTGVLTAVVIVRPQSTSSNSTAALVVTVHGAANRPVAGANIKITAEHTAFKLEAATPEDGVYRGPALDPGRYRIAVSAPCYRSFESGFEVVSDKPATVTASLTPVGAASPCKATDFEYADSGGLKAGEIAGAVDAAGYSSQAEPKSPELRQTLAEIVAGAGGRGSADNPAESSLFDRGNELLRHGDYQQAAEVFRDGAERYPSSERVLLALGVTYYSGAHYDEAAEALCRAADLDPVDPRPYFFLAHTEWSKPSETAPVLQRLETNAGGHSSDAAAQYEYAIALRRAQTLGAPGIDGGAVERLLRSAIALDDSFAEAHFELGVALSASRPAQAIAEFQRVITLQPDWAEAHYRLGQLYGRTRAREKAAAEIAEYDRLHRRGAAGQEERFRDELRRLMNGAARDREPGAADRNQSANRQHINR